MKGSSFMASVPVLSEGNSSEQHDREHLRGKDAQQRGERIDGGVGHGRRVGASDVGERRRARADRSCCRRAGR
jgi:hypothetical protein